MQNVLITLMITVVGGVLVLLIEYFVMQRNPEDRKKLFHAIVLSLFPFLPLFLFQLISAEFVAATMKQLPEVVRVEWYSNLYAVFAMFWGLLWGTKVRSQVRGKLEGSG